MSTLIGRLVSRKFLLFFCIACVDEEKREEIGIKSVSEILEKDLGGWPVLQGDKWNGKDYNVWEQNLKAYHLGKWFSKK